MNDERLYRRTPHSPEAEQAVLGSMLIDAECIKDVVEKLRPEDFCLRRNREVFEAIRSMFLGSRLVDALTVAAELTGRGVCDSAVARDYLAGLMAVTPTSANVSAYVDAVLGKAPPCADGATLSER